MDGTEEILFIPIYTYLLLICPTQENYNISMQKAKWKGQKERGSYL